MKKLAKILTCFLICLLASLFFASCSFYPAKYVQIIVDSSEDADIEPESTYNMGPVDIATSYIYNAAERASDYLAEAKIDTFLKFVIGEDESNNLCWPNGSDFFSLEEDPLYSDQKHFFYNDANNVVCVWTDGNNWYCNSQYYSYEYINNFTIKLTLIYDMGQIEPSHNYLYVHIYHLMNDFKEKFSAYLLSYILTNGADGYYMEKYQACYNEALYVEQLYREWQGKQTTSAKSQFETAKNNFETAHHESYEDFLNNYVEASDIFGVYRLKYTEAIKAEDSGDETLQNNFFAKYNEKYSDFIERISTINASGIDSYYNAGILFCQNYIWDGSHLDSSLWKEAFWKTIAEKFWIWQANS